MANLVKSADQWARVNALRERGIAPRGAPNARVAQARAEAQRIAAQRAAKAGRSK